MAGTDERAAADLRFQLLGPIEVHRGGENVPLRGAQPRCVLAMLLLSAGTTTSAERLVDAVWGDDPPREPRNMLQVHVSRLRGALAGDPTVELSTVGRHGYRLDVPAESVDLYRFRALVSEAEASDDAERAVWLLDDALGLWQGEPLGDAAGDLLAQRFAPALEEERLRAVETRVTARMRLGRYEEVVPELSMLVAEHPARASLVTALMQALYACGRTDEALGAFRDLRTRMVEELGVEPPRDVQDVHRAILQGTDTGTGRRRRTRDGPAQLPADPASFVGRSAELGYLHTALGCDSTTPRVALVSGPPGTGKTTLAVHAAHLLRDSFPDGQLYAHLAGVRDPVDPEDVLAGFLAAFGVTADELPPHGHRAALFRSVTAGLRLLVVLDDARDVEQVRPLLPAGAGTAVLVTARPTLASLDADVRVSLGGLDHDDAVRLLGTEVDTMRLRADPAAVDDVVAACGGLALALRIVGRRLATTPHWSVRSLADRLADERERLDELTLDDLSVRASIRLTYRRLDEPAAQAFRLLGLVTGADVGLTEAAALLDLPPAQAHRRLDGLRSASLVDSDDGERFRMHDLLRAFARAEAEQEPGGGRLDAVQRLASAYAGGLRNATLARAPGLVLEDFRLPVEPAAAEFTSAAKATAWLERERGNVAAIVQSACELHAMSPASVSRVAGAFARFADPAGHLAELAAVTEAAVAYARSAGDHNAEGVALIGLGTLRLRQHGKRAGLPDTRKAVALLADTGTRSEATALNNLAHCADEPEERSESLRRSLLVYESIGDERGAIIALANIADHHLRMGEYRAAVEVGERGINRARALEAPDLSTTSQITVAEALHYMGGCSEAVRLIRRTLEEAESLGNGIVTSLASLAYARMLRDDDHPADAVDWYERTLTAFRDIGAEHDVATTTVELGDVLDALGQRRRARACWTSAVATLDRLGTPDAIPVHERLADAG
ncbi:MAG: winged helix-turn-helix domain-containing protein [Streptosporangiales bacterium]|nr:winged helix-turn-helix domain-containing protein [Streptosporangiales bacterium]MBO0891135.1 winged helix-turn-helix domain-containing protein [Acidothermales bacterium]